MRIVIIVSLVLAVAWAKPSLLQQQDGVLLQYRNLSPRVPLGSDGIVHLIASNDGTGRIVETAPIGSDGRVVDTSEVVAAKEAHARARINDQINLVNEAARSAAADETREQLVDISGGLLQGRNLLVDHSGPERDFVEVDNSRGRLLLESRGQGENRMNEEGRSRDGENTGRGDVNKNDGSAGGQNDQSRSTLVQASGSGLLQIFVTDDGGIVSSVTPSIGPDGLVRARLGQGNEARVGQNGRFRPGQDQLLLAQNGQDGQVRVLQEGKLRLGPDGRLLDKSEATAAKAIRTLAYVNDRLNLANHAARTDSDLGINDEGVLAAIPSRSGEASVGADGRVVDTPEVAVARALHAAVHANERVRLVQEAVKANEAVSDVNDPCPCGIPY